MKTLTFSFIVACNLLCPGLYAQRGGMHGGGTPGFRPSGPSGHPNAGGPLMTGFRSERRGYMPAGFAPWGWGFPSYDSDRSYSPACNEAQSPQVIVVAPQAPPPPPPPPPEPARLVTHEYNWPDAAKPAADHFALVSKDGSVRFAIAVWVQDGKLQYTQTDGTAGSAPLDTLDREATRRLNADN
jgi:hypothetical protein